MSALHRRDVDLLHLQHRVHRRLRLARVLGIEQTLERRPDASVMAEAAARARALYGGEVVCAQLEDLYAELVERA